RRVEVPADACSDELRRTSDTRAAQDDTAAGLKTVSVDRSAFWAFDRGTRRVEVGAKSCSRQIEATTQYGAADQKAPRHEAIGRDGTMSNILDTCPVTFEGAAKPAIAQANLAAGYR